MTVLEFKILAVVVIPYRDFKRTISAKVCGFKGRSASILHR